MVSVHSMDQLSEYWLLHCWPPTGSYRILLWISILDCIGISYNHIFFHTGVVVIKENFPPVQRNKLAFNLSGNSCRHSALIILKISYFSSRSCVLPVLVNLTGRNNILMKNTWVANLQIYTWQPSYFWIAKLILFSF